MAGNMQQDAARMAKAQNALIDGREKLNNHSARLNNELLGMATGWQGRGGDAFQRAQTAWGESFGKLNQTLDRLSEALGSASKVATSADDDVSAQAQSLTSNMESGKYTF